MLKQVPLHIIKTQRKLYPRPPPTYTHVQLVTSFKMAHLPDMKQSYKKP